MLLFNLRILEAAKRTAMYCCTQATVEDPNYNSVQKHSIGGSLSLIQIPQRYLSRIPSA